MHKVFLAAAAAIAVASLLGGCASTPAGVSSSAGRQLIITMTVAGQINPLFYYFCVIRNANDANPTTGPVPVIAAPWGNGFVAGSATQVIEYNNSIGIDGYGVYSINQSSSGLLSIGSPLAPPVQYTPVSNGSNTLAFRIPLSELATASVPASSINYLQINFINTDTLPVNSNDRSAQHDFDALGNTSSGEVNKFITISTASDATFDNSTLGAIEPSNDVATCTGNGVNDSSSVGGVEPFSGSQTDEQSLDIVNWSVQVSG